MVNRLVSVGDDFTLPAAVKAADANLPERLSEPSLSATIATATGGKADRVVGKALGKLHAGLAARNSTPARLVFTGSSTTAGHAASTPEASYVNIMLRRIQAQFPASAAEPAMIASTSADFGALSTAGGVHGYNAGESGTISGNYLTDAEADKIAAIAPLAVFHMIGSNDFSSDVPLATYRSNVLGRIARIKAGTSAPLVQVLLHPYERFDTAVTDGTANTWAAYGQVLKEIADADPENVAFLDVSAPYYAAGVPGADPLNLADPDAIHLTDAGYYLMAMLILRGLGLNTASASGTATATATVPAGHPVLTDYFVRTDGAIGTALSGQAWTAATGAWVIDGNQARASTGGTVIANAGTSDNLYVSAVFNLSTDAAAAGVLARAVGDTSRIGVFLEPSGLLQTFVKYGATNATVTAIPAHPAYKSGQPNIVGLHLKGDTVTSYLNGVKGGTYTLNATEAAGVNIAGNTNVGLRSGGSTLHKFDSFSAQNV